jgi:hypothetical protein
MLIYWALFAYFALGAWIDARREPDLHRRRPYWIIGGLLILVMIGLRYKVGADWVTYELIFRRASNLSFARAIDMGDPGYQALNWAVARLGADVWLVNLVCASLFTYGLFRFARLQPYPWLAVLVAVPYMVIVVSNYTRQAAALGLVMAGLSALIRSGSLARFLVYAVLASTFHRTAVAVLPLAIFSRPRNRLLNVLGGLAVGFVMYDFFLADSMDQFVSNYIKTKYSSQGAAIRIAMEVLAASVFLVRRKRFEFPEHEDKLWLYFSLASFAALVALVVTPSSTAVDRLSIYLMPLQMVILSRVPFVYVSRGLGVMLVMAYSFTVELVWLNFAQHAKYWVPYHFYPLAG